MTASSKGDYLAGKGYMSGKAGKERWERKDGLGKSLAIKMVWLSHEVIRWWVLSATWPDACRGWPHGPPREDWGGRAASA